MYGHQRKNVQSSFVDSQMDYKAAKRSTKFRPRRPGIPSSGANADYHYRSEADYLWMAELAEELYRNDVVLGSITDRAVINTVQDGFTFQPNTGDDKLDDRLAQRWLEDSQNPKACDASGQFVFAEMERMVLRAMLVSGDMFGLPLQDGTVQLIESHRCRQPSRSKQVKENIVHGVELGPLRERLAYWFTKDRIDPFDQVLKGDLQRFEAFNADGLPLVFHSYFPKRPTQTRGITAYAPIFDYSGMHDDVQFAQLIKQQQSSLIFLLRQRGVDFDPTLYGSTMGVGTDVSDDGETRQLIGVGPATELTGLKGETISGWTPNIPNAEFFPHTKLILTFVGINLGMPLVLTLMDASETNFSGYRGAVDQARMIFRANQKQLIRSWHNPYIAFKMRYWASDDAALSKALATGRSGRSRVRFDTFEWRTPEWPYIEPTKDATADLIAEANMLTSPRRRCARRGAQHKDIAAETIADRAFVIALALNQATDINDKFGLAGADAVQWRDLAPLPTPQGVTAATTLSESVAVQTDETEESNNAKPADQTD